LHIKIEMKKTLALGIIVTVIFMMLLYASFSKYFDFAAFKRGMYNQPFPAWLSSVLIIFLPPIEIVLAILLTLEKTKKKALVGTIVMMTAFTLYIVAILLNFFPHVPCSCGGIIRALSWEQHLIFNLFFIAIGLIGVKIMGKTENINTKRVEFDHKS